MICRKILTEILQGIISIFILAFVILNYFSILTPETFHGILRGDNIIDNYVNGSDMTSNMSVDNGVIQDFNEDNINNLSFQRMSANTFIRPKERTIVLRLDDVQGYLWNNISISIIDAVLIRNMSITLGVIPGRHINDDDIIRDYLLGNINNPRIEIAQHGYVHTKFEFANQTEDGAYNLTKSGLEDMINTLNVRPTTFIPPDNAYNDNTTKAISKLGFKIMSAKEKEYKFDGNLTYIGYTIATKHSDEKDLTSTSKIIDSCVASLDKNNFCVIMIHPQDLVDDDNKSLNKTRYEKFVDILDKLKTINGKFATFRDLENG